MKKGTIWLILIIAAILLLLGAKYNLLAITSYQAYQSFSSANPITVKLIINEPEPQTYETVKFGITASFSQATEGYRYGCAGAGATYNSRSTDCRNAGYQDGCSGSAPTGCQPHNECVWCWAYNMVTPSVISCSIDGTKVFEKKADGTQTIGTNAETTNLASYFNKFIPVASENIVYMTCSSDKSAGSIIISPEATSRDFKVVIVEENKTIEQNETVETETTTTETTNETPAVIPARVVATEAVVTYQHGIADYIYQHILNFINGIRGWLRWN